MALLEFAAGTMSRCFYFSSHAAPEFADVG
jgi:hypothetical protein